MKDLFEDIGESEPLVARVVAQIETLIISERLKPGEILPSQTQLATKLGVSRTVVREAVRILVTKGLLETRRGIGTRVRTLTYDQVSEPIHLVLETRMGGITYHDLHQVRTILETEIAGLAASNATEQDLAHLTQNLREMEAAAEQLHDLAKWDARFHRTLAEATHNPLLLILSESIRGLLEKCITLLLPYQDPYTDLFPYHHAILDEVKQQSVEGARQAMRAHLYSVAQIHKMVYGEQNTADDCLTQR